jgi:hypothetical protein
LSHGRRSFSDIVKREGGMNFVLRSSGPPLGPGMTRAERTAATFS